MVSCSIVPVPQISHTRIQLGYWLSVVSVSRATYLILLLPRESLSHS